MLRKSMWFVLLLMLALALEGCGGNDKQNDQTQSQQGSRAEQEDEIDMETHLVFVTEKFNELTVTIEAVSLVKEMQEGADAVGLHLKYTTRESRESFPCTQTKGLL